MASTPSCIVRNLSTSNVRPSRPTRVWRKWVGPFDVTLTPIAIVSSSGERNSAVELKGRPARTEPSLAQQPAHPPSRGPCADANRDVVVDRGGLVLSVPERPAYDDIMPARM